jgi:hypothetical protein
MKEKQKAEIGKQNAEIQKAEESPQAGILASVAVRCHSGLSHAHYRIVSFYAEDVNGKTRIFVMRQ